MKTMHPQNSKSGHNIDSGRTSSNPLQLLQSYSSGTNTHMPVQKISKLTVGTEVLTEKDEKGAEAFKLLNIITKNFPGEVWFNSAEELVNYIRNRGKVEGIGIWNNRWINFSGKGPIVFGEQHNQIRQDFIDTLNITHYVVEGAFERSLTGVADTDIPAASHQGAASHTKYTGNGPGKALENFWVRHAQGMARFWIAFENELRKFDPKNPEITQIERLSELEELIKTVRNTRIDTTGKDGIALEINKEILNAQFYINEAIESHGLPDIFTLMKKDYRAFRFTMPDVLNSVNARGKGIHYLYVCFSMFRQSIEKIGYLQFKAHASPEQLEADELTKNSTDPFKVWGGRRELFMLKNLEEALGKSPKPLITTMGVAHATNQRDQLQTLVRNHGGMLIMGSITDLADVGAAKMHVISEDISQQLAMMYGWSEKARKEYAKSPEALESAKIRLSNSKQPTPSYIS